MRLSTSLAWIVRRLAGPADAESMIADLECEAAEREERDGPAASRRWVRRQIVRSAPGLIRRRVDVAARGIRKGPNVLFRGLWLDLQLIARRLRRSPAFAIFAIAMLGLGIGAATSVFTLAYTIWLKPLPYRDPDTLVTITSLERVTSLHAGLSNPEVQEVAGHVPALAGVSGYHYGAIFGRFGDEPARLLISPVSTTLFSVLGVTPQIGRTFTAADEGTSVAVLSDGLWRERFHADPHVLGATVGGRAEQYTIIGVMPREFRFPLQIEADCWVPELGARGDRAARIDEVVARLAPGATLAQVNAQLTSVSEALAAAYPETNAHWTFVAAPFEGTSSPAYRAAFITLLSMVGLFLLIACANLASLFVARNLARRHELTVSLAIGAPRWRLARIVLLETALLSAAGAALALLLTDQAMVAFAHWLPATMPRLGDLRVNGTVFAFAMAVAACTSALCAIAPIAGVKSLVLAQSMSGTRTIGSTSHRGQYTLVVVEVALAAVLLMGGGAMVQSFNALLGRDRGYVPAGVAAMTVSLPFDDDRYRSAPLRETSFDRLFEGLAHIPGVVAAGASTGFPGSSLGLLGGGAVNVPGRTDPPVIAGLHDATPDYFRAMGVPIVRGRAFTNQDAAGSQRVVIVNETLAAQLWPHGDAIGQRFRVPAPNGLLNGANTDSEVVGVVADMHLGTRRNADMFVPFTQVPSFWVDLVVRTSGDPDAIAERVRQSIRHTNPDALVEHVSPLQTIVSNAYGLERAQSFLTALVAGLGGVIALVGLYALLNQYVARRTREMGICLALGSSPRRLFWSVFRRGLSLSLAGIGIGLGVALVAGRILRGQVFGLDLAGFGLFLPVAAVLVLASAFVIATSARRVIAIDPLIALRHA